jgi:hypothetical protein
MGSAAQQPRRRPRVMRVVFNTIYLAMLLCIVGNVGWQLLQGPINSFRNRSLRTEFEQRRAQWEALNINHYKITVGDANPAMIFCSNTRIEVLDGQVIRAERDPDLPSDSAFDCREMRSFQHLTIESLFALIANALYQSEGMYYGFDIEVEYDDLYGFPANLRLSNSSMGDAPNYGIRDFEPLD